MFKSNTRRFIINTIVQNFVLQLAPVVHVHEHQYYRVLAMPVFHLSRLVQISISLLFSTILYLFYYYLQGDHSYFIFQFPAFSHLTIIFPCDPSRLFQDNYHTRGKIGQYMQPNLIHIRQPTHHPCPCQYIFLYILDVFKNSLRFPCR